MRKVSLQDREPTEIYPDEINIHISKKGYVNISRGSNGLVGMVKSLDVKLRAEMDGPGNVLEFKGEQLRVQVSKDGNKYIGDMILFEGVDDFIKLQDKIGTLEDPDMVAEEGE